ncbi:hypothetical protein, partial [Vulcanisaeta distributa]|uniref:hypothetical protein n=1 Tax=Vulcanisaeta distributa TaxID=164451 RepID=UPI000A60BF63
MNNVSGSVNVRHSRPTMPLMIAIVIVLVIIAFTVILLFSLPSSIWLEISEHYPYNTSNPFDLNNTLLIFLFPKSINLNGGYNSLYVIIAFQENNKIYAIYYYYYPYYPYSSSEDITKCNDTQSIIVGYVSTCNANFNAFPQMLITETYTFSYPPQGLLPSILLPYYILNGIYTTEPNESFINITTFLRTLIRDIKDGKITQLDVYLTDGNVFWLLLSNKIEYLNSSNFYLLAPGLVVYNYTQLQLNIQGTIMKPQWIQITEEHNVFGPYYTVNFEWFIVRNVSLNAFITNNSNDDWLFSSMNIISIYSYSYFQMVMIFIIPFILITYTIIRELHDFYDTTIKKPAMNTEETIGKAIKENIYIIILTTSFIFSTQSVALQNYPHLDNFTLYMLF